MSRFDDAAWVLTRRISPRPTVRVADIVDTEVTNSYARNIRISGERPATPWAMYLADDAGYRYLVFDLDAGLGNAANDADRLSFWLHDLGLPHVTCQSGPTGGRHIWLALDHAASHDLVASIAITASQLLPSLDNGMLKNPATGCVRPPGTPHRAGGRSAVLAGVTAKLIHPSVTAEHLALLLRFFLESGATLQVERGSVPKGVLVDDAGHMCLAGGRRVPSRQTRTLLDQKPEANTSVTLARVLAGLARARWRLADVWPMLDAVPAFEHARTVAGAGGRRVPVSPERARRRLAAEWERAVLFVAANPVESRDGDGDFVVRAGEAADAIARVQTRAQSMPGLWGFDRMSRVARAVRTRRPARLVLDAVCLYLAQSASSVVEVDVRRLAQDTGYGRESCRLALLELTAGDDPWLVKVEDAAGVHGAKFRLHRRFSTEADDRKWSQVEHAPLPGTAHRTYWINQLSHTLGLLAQDAFAAPRSLGRTAGRVFASLAPGAVVTAAEVVARSQVDSHGGQAMLRRLAKHGLASRVEGGWTREPDIAISAVAEELGVTGFLSRRSVAYEAERAVWSWWQAEHRWMSASRRRRLRDPTTVSLFAQSARREYPRYPRGGSGRRGDHRRAVQLVRGGALSAPEVVFG